MKQRITFRRVAIFAFDCADNAVQTAHGIGSEKNNSLTMSHRGVLWPFARMPYVCLSATYRF